jgi:D-sedoheptulose 7-phosphate isomerase
VNFNLNEFWRYEADEHLNVAEKTFETLQDEFREILELCETALLNGNKLLFFGNGGSAADAQHLATEFAVRYAKDRRPMAAIALTTDTSALTAAGNDYGFEHIFARQIEAIGKPGDVAIGISTSGKSPNVLQALKIAKQQKISTIGFTGESGGDMNALCDVTLKIPSKTTARIQEMHITIGQMLCGALEKKLGLI